jgi:hypothetical protein
MFPKIIEIRIIFLNCNKKPKKVGTKERFYLKNGPEEKEQMVRGLSVVHV